MTHVGQERRLGDVRGVSYFLGFLKFLIGLVQFTRALLHREFDSAVGQFQFRLTPGDAPHFRDALMAHDEKEDIFKKHPTSVLSPAKRVGGYRPKNRLRPKGAAQKMIECHHNRRRDQDTPVPIKREKCQGAENVEMSFNPAASKVNK